MALTYPGGRYAPLETVQRQPRMRGHDVVCVHTMVGSLSGTDGYFRQGGWSGTESHFGTGPNGEVTQWQDLAFTADANLNGNGTVISWENADRGTGYPTWDSNDGGAIPDFTPLQFEALAKGLAWCCAPSTHASCPATWECHRVGIPLALIPDTKPGRRGIGFHAQGVPGNLLIDGGVAWSSARGKTCPGRRRIARMPALIARAQAITTGHDIPVPPPAQEEDMSLNDADKTWLSAAVQQATLNVVRGEGISGVANQVASALRSEGVSGAGQISSQIIAHVAGLEAAVATLATGQALSVEEIKAASQAGAQQALATIAATVTLQPSQ